MTAPQSHTLTKEERLCGKTTVSALISSGKWGVMPHLRYCWSAGHETGLNRIMVSVPKKFFKRAVKRNLLKRRMREAYRLQKELLPTTGIDLLLAYSHAEAADFATIYAEVTTILGRISSSFAGSTSSSFAGSTSESQSPAQ